MNAVSLEFAEDEHLQLKALTMTERATALVIMDQPSLAAASEFLLAVKDLRAEAEKHHRPMIDAAHRAHKAACDGLRRVDEPLARAEATVKPKIAGYLSEQKRIADEQERQRQEIIRKEAEETRRLQEEALERDLEHAEASGATPEEIKAIIEQPVAMPVYQAPRPMPTPIYTAPKGITSRETWSAEVTDIKALCRAIADGKPGCPTSLVVPNMTALSQMARALKGALQIPGVRAVSTSNIAAGRR